MSIAGSSGDGTVEAPVIYLDTQDYSRFGDVLRGRGDIASERLFADLEARKAAGTAIFAVSMPLLSELLQYDRGFRDTTLCKAEAVERLCGPYALPYPSKVVAMEVAAVVAAEGIVDARILPPFVTADRNWFPDVSNAFADFKARVREEGDQQIRELKEAGIGNRAARRNVKRTVRTLDIRVAAEESAPEMAARFGLPTEAIIDSFVAFLKGRITGEEASRRLFASIAELRRFVETYFERLDTDRSLPTWISELGVGFSETFAKLRVELRSFVEDDALRPRLRKLIAEWKPALGTMVLRMGAEEFERHGVTQDAVSALRTDPDLAARVPACAMVAAVFEGYILQVVGISATDARIEDSFGGDLMHALYLPHVDLWRGDRRFSRLVKDALPEQAHRVVASSADLPGAIDAWHRARGR